MRFRAVNTLEKRSDARPIVRDSPQSAVPMRDRHQVACLARHKTHQRRFLRNVRGHFERWKPAFSNAVLPMKFSLRTSSISSFPILRLIFDRILIFSAHRERDHGSHRAGGTSPMSAQMILQTPAF
jgi:hypothetical protein